MLDLQVKPSHDAPLCIALMPLPLAVDSLPSIHSYARNWPAAPSTPSRQGIGRRSASGPLGPKSLALTDCPIQGSRPPGVSRPESATMPATASPPFWPYLRPAPRYLTRRNRDGTFCHWPPRIAALPTGSARRRCAPSLESHSPCRAIGATPAYWPASYSPGHSVAPMIRRRYYRSFGATDSVLIGSPDRPEPGRSSASPS